MLQDIIAPIRDKNVLMGAGKQLNKIGLETYQISRWQARFPVISNLYVQSAPMIYIFQTYYNTYVTSRLYIIFVNDHL